MNEKIKKKKEFGDFQTPNYLADRVCEKLLEIGIQADSIIEPTCGVGAFVLSSSTAYPNANIYGFEINPEYLQILEEKISSNKRENIKIQQSDFFLNNWKETVAKIPGRLLVIGNFPWVTNATQGSLGSDNLPEKNNFLDFKGFDAITGKANFDISEWMLIENLSWFKDRSGTIAMLVKTAVARKILAHAEKFTSNVTKASIYKINAKEAFDASVEACLLVIEFDSNSPINYDYSIYDDLKSDIHHTVGHRDGMTIANLEDYEQFKYLLGESDVKWRSGVKHDLSSIMELTKQDNFYINGLDEIVDIEPDLLYPLMKGSDIGSNKSWRRKYVIITQKSVGMDTSFIEHSFPKTWSYLIKHSDKLDARGSTIYKKNPRFSIFGVGDYSFKQWKIAICSLYKSLSFRLVEPIEDRPVQFDDTVYFISFDTKEEATEALAHLQSNEVIKILNSLIFWDDKRPIKTSVLNQLRFNTKKSESQINLFS